MRENVIKKKSFEFAVTVVNLYKILVAEKKEFVMSKQLLRSGTSIGAVYREAEHAESKADFIHKMAIAQKECNEVLYWLDLLNVTGYMDKELYTKVHEPASELMSLVTSIVKTSKERKL